ncbi:MAG: FAD-dependent oxidoreductase, partial [Candidatus Neomarinimicrobiota bacterium]
SFRPAGGFIQFPQQLRRQLEVRGGEVRTGVTVQKILIENGRAYGVELTDGTQITTEYVVSTADTKVTFGKMVGYDLLSAIDSAYGKKVRRVKMSPSSIAIHLGLDGQLDLRGLGFDCGYNVLTTGRGAHEKMFRAWDNGELLLDDDCFHLAVISPCLKTGGKQNLIIHVVPVAAAEWIDLQKNDPTAYRRKKTTTADFYIDKVQQYLIPGLRDHIRFTDVATPATYARFIASPTGSNFDMLPVPANFGKNRLPTRTPIKNLFVPKFSHGIWPSLQAGLQVVDMISRGKIMNGNSSFKTDNKVR